MSGQVLNRPEAAGYALGAELDRLYEQCEPFARLKAPELPPRCNQCVFRKGTLPNGCVTTVMDALKCAMERDTPFLCVHRGKGPDGEYPECAGWQAWVLTGDEAGVRCPWPFSDEGAP